MTDEQPQTTEVPTDEQKSTESKESPDSPVPVSQNNVDNTETAPKPASEEKDQFGRTINHSSIPEPEDDGPQVDFPAKRPLIDAEIELNYVKTLSPDNVKIANQIAKVIVMIGNPSSRLNDAEINEMATKLFTGFSKYTDILLQMFFASMVRMSPQIESLAALIGTYCERFYKTYINKLIQNVIPDALKDAFEKDHFRVVKLLLRFLGAFVSYKLVKASSFIALLQNLADMIDSATPCRGENLSRAIIVACKTAPAVISDDDLHPIIQKVKAFISTRPKNFIQRFSPIKNNDVSFLDILVDSERLSHFTEAYMSLFAKTDDSRAESIPNIEFVFGPVDQAPFPFVVLQSDEVTAGFDPIIADIADDILVFFGDDANLTADQMLALPMLLNHPSLKLAQSNENIDSHFIIPLFNTVILSDLLRIPNSYYPPSFHVCVFTNLIDMKKESQIIQSNLSPVILNIVNDISSLDPGCYFRLVRFFSHYISLYKFSWCWDKWAGFPQLAENDMRAMFLRNVISHCYYFGNVESISRRVKETFSSIMPPKPEIVFEYQEDERSTSLREKLVGEQSDIEKFREEFNELVSIQGEFAALNVFFANIFYLGNGDTTDTIKRIDEFREYIIEFTKDEDWKKSTIVASAIKFFKFMPPVLEEVLIYFIANRFFGVDAFINFFFTDTSTDTIKSPESWELFNGVMGSIIAMHIAKGQNNKAQEAVKSVFTSASEFFNEFDRNDYDVVAEKFIIGNLKEFGRQHYDIFASIDSEMNALIAAEGISESFREIISTISSFGSQ